MHPLPPLSPDMQAQVTRLKAQMAEAEANATRGDELRRAMRECLDTSPRDPLIADFRAARDALGEISQAATVLRTPTAAARERSAAAHAGAGALRTLAQLATIALETHTMIAQSVAEARAALMVGPVPPPADNRITVDADDVIDLRPFRQISAIADDITATLEGEATKPTAGDPVWTPCREALASLGNHISEIELYAGAVKHLMARLEAVTPPMEGD